MPGESLRYRGTWTNVAFYTTGDVVEVEGVLYVCVADFSSSLQGDSSDPTESDFWTQLSGEGGGGGTSARWLDLGTVNAADLVSGGRQVLYTTAAGEFVSQVRFGDVLTLLDQTVEIAVGIEGIPDVGNGLVKLAAIGGDSTPTNTFDSFQNAANTVNFNAGTGALGLAINAIPLQTGTLIATLNQTPGILGATPGWQANHAYTAVTTGGGDPISMIVAVGHLWTALSAGTSGGSTPDFAGNIGGFTGADGTVAGWNDSGPVPTAGSVHLYAEIVTPVAP